MQLPAKSDYNTILLNCINLKKNMVEDMDLDVVASSVAVVTGTIGTAGD
jgi:hypothetical protein